MATGDILSFVLDASGWFATVKVEGLGTGGTYDFGFGAKNDPTNAKIKLSLTSQGYTGTVLGTTSREIYGIPCFQPFIGAMRLVYPGQANPNETVNGSDVDIVIALSEWVYSPDTLITADFLSGWYTQGGTPSNAITGLNITNASTVPYQKPVANWAYPGYSKVTGDFGVEISALHKSGVECVVISATDGVTTVSETISNLTISSLPDYNAVLIYASTIDTSGFNDGIITVDFVVYPKVGNASHLRDSSDGVNTWPTPLYTSQEYRLDTGNNHGHTVVDPTNGNDGTGTVYSSQVLAEAGFPYQTHAAALTGLQSYHNINAGHNDCGGGNIYQTEDTATLNSANGGTPTEWVTIKPISTASRANTILQPATTNSAFPTMMKCENIYMSGSGYFRGFNSDSIWYDKVDMNQTGSLSLWQSVVSQATHCTGDFPRGFDVFSTSMNQYGIIRGNSFVPEQNANGGYTVLGNRNVNIKDRGNTANVALSNILFAFNTIDHSTDVVQISLAMGADNLDGFAMVQNLLVRYGTQVTPMTQISADSSTTTTNNIIIWHNTVVGARSNNAYNDIASGGPYSQDQWSMVNNIWSNWNNKDDTFNDNSDATGGWPVGYGVGASGDFRRTSAAQEWFGEFQGVGANFGTTLVPLDPSYVEDNSADGANTSGGDYHLQESSPARGLIQRQVLPYDLDGRARRSDGSVGALEYYAITEPDDLILSSIILEQTKATKTIIADPLLLSSIILQPPEVTGIASPENLILSSIVLEEASIGGTIKPEDLILSAIILESPDISGSISPDNLVLSAIILNQTRIIPSIIPNNLVLSSIILGETKETKGVYYKVLITNGNIKTELSTLANFKSELVTKGDIGCE